MRASTTGLGVSDTRVGVSNTVVSISISVVSVSDTAVGVSIDYRDEEGRGAATTAATATRANTLSAIQPRRGTCSLPEVGVDVHCPGKTYTGCRGYGGGGVRCRFRQQTVSIYRRSLCAASASTAETAKRAKSLVFYCRTIVFCY